MTTEKPIKELILLGKGPSRVECIYDQETWCCNDSYEFAKRIDKLFVFDDWKLLDIKDLKYFLPEYNYEIISGTPCPDPTLKVTIYPIEEVITKFRTAYFGNTICYMIAYALLLGFEKIRMYGIDMSSYSCYAIERPAVEFWLGIAKGMGVEIVNTKNSATLKNAGGKIYGYWGDREPGINEMIKKVLKQEGYGKNIPFWWDAIRRDMDDNLNAHWASGPLEHPIGIGKGAK